MADVSVCVRFNELSSMHHDDLGIVILELTIQTMQAADASRVTYELNNTKVADITVGERPIGIVTTLNTTYVANAGSNSVSVISAENNTKVADITVGERPIDIANYGDIIYVANAGSNSVSVISAENNTKIGQDIPVGDSPAAIGVDYWTDIIYVANAGSNSVSVIAGITEKLVSYAGDD